MRSYVSRLVNELIAGRPGVFFFLIKNAILFTLLAVTPLEPWNMSIFGTTAIFKRYNNNNSLHNLKIIYNYVTCNQGAKFLVGNNTILP